MTTLDLILRRLESELGLDAERFGGEGVLREQITAFLSARQTDPLSDENAWRELISLIMIPETRFLRYPESFEELKIFAAARPGKRIEVLCAACSTGEEAWSIAMTLKTAGSESFHIDALDVSASAIGKAGAGSYTERELSGLPDEWKDRWIEPAGAFVPELRQRVSFRVSNLLEDQAISGIYDVIFCRNLLIYCDGESQHRIFSLLEAHLAPDGLLFLGPGEATCAAGHGWVSTPHSMSFAFVRTRPVPPTPPPPMPPRRVPPKPSVAIVPPVAPTPAAAPRKQSSDVRTARFLADAGRVEEAAEELAAFHSANTPTADSLLLEGILAETRGQPDAAEAAYRKSLYLDPEQLDALWHLSLLLEASDRPDLARPFRRRAEKLAGQ